MATFIAGRTARHRIFCPFTASSISLPLLCRQFESSYSTFPPSSIGKDHHFAESKSCRLEEEDFSKKIRRVVLEVRNGTVEDVVRALQSDQSCSRIQLTSRAVESVICKFGDDWKSALGFFRWSSSQSDYDHPPHLYNKMVDLLGKMRQMDRMWDLVSEMREGGFVTLETIAKVMRRSAGAKQWKDAIKLFDDLGSMGLEKDAESMNLLLDTLCKEKKVEFAREVYLALKTHILPGAHTFNIFVHGWCNANRTDEAMWTIQEMKGYGFRPSVITYSTIIQAHCNQFEFSRAYELLDEMVDEGCPPNVVTYTTIMHSLAKARKIDEALGIVEKMKSSGCKPDTIFYNSFINILGRAGRVHKASHIFGVEMQKNGVTLNLSTYNTMISIYCQHAQEQDALNVLKEMEYSSCKPVLQTFTPLLKQCFKARREDKQLKSLLSDIVNKHHLSLDSNTYTLLIHGLCSIDKSEWACLLYDEMIGREILPRVRTCKMLMREAEQKNMDGVVDKLKSFLKQIDKSSY